MSDEPLSSRPVGVGVGHVTYVGLGAGMVTRGLTVRAEDVVFVKGVVEASEGVAQVFAVRGGDLTLASPEDREAELDELWRELAHAVGGHLASR